MVKRKPTPRQQSVNNRAYQSGENNASSMYETKESAPRQRGRPRKVPLEEMKEEDIGNIVSKALHVARGHNKNLVTHMNGFFRSFKPDGIMGAFYQDNVLILGVRFKGRKLPQFVEVHEVKIRAPILLIQYYLANLEYA